MDYVPPGELLQATLTAASKKARLSVRDMLLRGFLAGAILAYATSLAFVVLSQGLAPIIAAILFPVGFVILVLLGLSIPVHEGKAVEIAGRRLAIFNLGDSFVAVDDCCPHRGGPLSDGIVSGSSVTCPLHAWSFDLRSGNVLNHPESSACLSTFPVRIEEGVVCVQLPLDEPVLSKPNSCEHRDRPVRWVLRKPPSPANVRSNAP
jgi:nitrite reductase (NADH) small subunit